MRSQAAHHSISTMSRLLQVSRSGYYAWATRPPSARSIQDVEIVRRIQAVHAQSRGTYGAPRVHAELVAEGRHIACKRVARLMRAKGLQGVSRRKWTTTTKRNRGEAVAPDLVKRDFRVGAADQLWVADITYVPTWAGFLYVAVVLDAWSRRVVGWAFAGHLRVHLVLAALEMAIRVRQPRSVIHHSDHGSQYTSIAYGLRCRQAGIRPSMGSVGDAYDNAMCESFFATLECELLDRVSLRTRAEAEREVFEFIEGFYNSSRRHSSLGYLSPSEFEHKHLGVAQVESPDLSTETG
jgi:putative transposase